LSRERSATPHVAVVSQNADLELDIRPRAEAEALAGAGYRVTLVGGTRSPERVREVTDPVVELALYRLPAEASGALGQILELTKSFWLVSRTVFRLARRTPIDVLHAANPPDNLWLLSPVVRLAQGFRPRFVFDQHDVAPVLLAEKYGSGPMMRSLEWLAKVLERASFSRASLTVFANSEYERRAVANKLLAGNGAVVPNGWELPPATPSPLWRGDARRLVAYVGAMGEQDCLVHLVEAVALLEEKDVKVVLAGDGSARAEAQKRAAELEIANSFTWLGWVGRREEIASLVRSADVCVAPETASAFNELASFVKLVEYMSAGAPVVAHRLPQTEALCADTIAFADDMSAQALGRALDEVLADGRRAEALGAAARERFEGLLRWENVGAPKLVEAYRSAFGGAR
jgi:glycosyltransferase involved in cell wall biosynthesis